MPASENVQSVVRATEILELVSFSEGGMTLKELSLALKLKPQTVHNLARTLVTRRLLEKLAHPPRYRLGEGLFQMVTRHHDHELRRKAGEAVHEIAARLPQATVVLAQGLGGEIQVLMRMSPERPGVAEQPQHHSLGAYASSSALVFQAFWTEEERNNFRRRYPFEEFGAGLWQSEATLDRYLEEVRQKGYALLPPTNRAQLRVAVPLFGVGNELRAVLGASVPATDPLAQPAGYPQVVKAVSDAVQHLSINP
jgi:DNA-binding IclR family transcriptional regulator